MKIPAMMRIQQLRSKIPHSQRLSLRRRKDLRMKLSRDILMKRLWKCRGGWGLPGGIRGSMGRGGVDMAPGLVCPLMPVKLPRRRRVAGRIVRLRK